MKIIKAIWDNILGLYSLVVGLMVTGRFLVSPTQTVHYPRQVIEPENIRPYRGPLELIPAEDPTRSRCISCLMCMKACPSGCITVEKAKAKAGEKGGSKEPDLWHFDFTLCSLCGSCVEACPADAIRFSHQVYLVGTTREEFYFDLLAKLQRNSTKVEG